MSTSGPFQPVDSKRNTMTPKISTTVVTEPDTLNFQSSHDKTTNPANVSIWELPGLDKDTFYAAALYLHAATGVLKAKPSYRGSKTPEATRNFLDHLADCFARSKDQDARDHVSATAMVRNEGRKEITLYIAKNKSEKGRKPLISEAQLDAITNENEEFGRTLVQWFNDLAKTGIAEANCEGHDRHWYMFKRMCNFSQSRLEHYIRKITESEIVILERTVDLHLDVKYRDGWEVAKYLINECMLYEKAKPKSTNPGNQIGCLLANYAHLAGQVRKYHGFRILTDKVETSTSDKRTKLKDLAQVVKWINYLGRLYAAHVGFYEFCRAKEQSGYSFKHQLLRSQEDEWTGEKYMQKIQSWNGYLGETVENREIIESKMGEIVQKTGNKARVHCEMQLMMHFSQTGVEQCLDYFGCSKRSCWLCWQIILQNGKYSMKHTHRKLYPRWAFPFNFSPSQPAVAEGLRAAYNEMLRLVQDSIINQIPLSSLEPYPQTSARMTPYNSRARTSNNLEQEPDSGLFSGNPISVPGLPAISVLAHHLPASGSGSDLREVQVFGYVTEESHASRSWIIPTIINSNSIVFAFELITESLDLLLEESEYRQGFWAKEEIWTGRPNVFFMYYRTDADTLDPNPYILEIWESIHGEMQQDFPWRGDVFMIPLHVTDLREKETISESSQIDNWEWSKDLEKYFQGNPDFASRVEQGQSRIASRIAKFKTKEDEDEDLKQLRSDGAKLETDFNEMLEHMDSVIAKFEMEKDEVRSDSLSQIDE